MTRRITSGRRCLVLRPVPAGRAGRVRSSPETACRGRERAPAGSAEPHRERGSATAELAIALPVVALTLLLGIGALGAGLRLVTLQDAVADAARILGRGDDAGGASAAVARADPDAGFSVSRSADLVCVTASAQTRILGAISVPIHATGCALDGGR